MQGYLRSLGFKADKLQAKIGNNYVPNHQRLKGGEKDVSLLTFTNLKPKRQLMPQCLRCV